ncbi:MAG: ribonuclease HI [Cyanothece sp. SIO1E1]|nr:ribonuclease HI [Cyanothece sp. SIO1E1]
MSYPGIIQNIYTDGACSGNPGPGGWGVVIYFTDGSVHEIGGADPETTNNRMEMQAAIAALEFLANLQPAHLQHTELLNLYTDSEYVKNGITKWIKGWKKKGWKTSTGKPVLNQDLWEQLDKLNSSQVHWQYVRGHTGNVGNERCDAIARAFSLGNPISLKELPQIEPKSLLNSKNRNISSEEAANLLKVTTFTPDDTSSDVTRTIQSGGRTFVADITNPTMAEQAAHLPADDSDNLPREVRVSHLRNLVDTLHMADEIARQGYLIASSELADLMDINASAVTSRGDNWVWRNWMVSRVRREGNQILWQLERVD